MNFTRMAIWSMRRSCKNHLIPNSLQSSQPKFVSSGEASHTFKPTKVKKERGLQTDFFPYIHIL